MSTEEGLNIVAAHEAIAESVPAGEHLARYELPKDYVVVDAVRRSASGKPDDAWARAQLAGN